MDGATAGDGAALGRGGVGPNEGKADVALASGEAHIPPAPCAGATDIDHGNDGCIGGEVNTRTCFQDNIPRIGRVGSQGVGIEHSAGNG